MGTFNRKILPSVLCTTFHTVCVSSSVVKNLLRSFNKALFFFLNSRWSKFVEIIKLKEVISKITQSECQEVPFAETILKQFLYEVGILRSIEFPLASFECFITHFCSDDQFRFACWLDVYYRKPHS